MALANLLAVVSFGGSGSRDGQKILSRHWHKEREKGHENLDQEADWQPLSSDGNCLIGHFVFIVGAGYYPFLGAVGPSPATRFPEP
jgi:hypothetical protein